MNDQRSYHRVQTDPASVVLQLLASFGLILALGCAPAAQGTPAPTAPARPPVEVTVASPTVREVIEYREYTGRTAAVHSVEIRARVSGYLRQSPGSVTRILTSRTKPTTLPVTTTGTHHTASPAPSRDVASLPTPPAEAFIVKVAEGSWVARGEPLFEIDAAPYQLALDQAIANFEAATALLQRYNLDLQRAKQLIGSNSVSKAEYDQAVANQATTTAQLHNLQALIDRAQLDLSYTRVVSPIEGMIGQSLVTDGNLVTADSTVLTQLVSIDPIYVYFDVDESSILDYRARQRSGVLGNSTDASIPIQLSLANDGDFAHAGVIDFVDNVTNASTGNTRLRGTFPNAKGEISPGLFARIQVPFSRPEPSLLIPTRALAMDQQGRYVMVVDPTGIVHRRTIVVGSTHGEETIIAQGIQPEETVVVAGLQKIRDGDHVRAVPGATAKGVDKAMEVPASQPPSTGATPKSSS